MEKQEAERLWNKLHDGLVDVESSIVEIIKRKAWEPLGYKTFHEAWNDRLKDCKLANSNGPIRSYVVYTFIDEGMSDEEIITTAKIPDSRVAGIRQAKEAGVPVERAYNAKPVAVTPGRGFMRGLPTPDDVLHIQFEQGELEAMREAANQYNFDLKILARDAVRNAVERRVNAFRRLSA